MDSVDASRPDSLEAMWAEGNEQIERRVGGRSNKMAGKTSSHQVLTHKPTFHRICSDGFRLVQAIKQRTGNKETHMWPLWEYRKSYKQSEVDASQGYNMGDKVPCRMSLISIVHS